MVQAQSADIASMLTRIQAAVFDLDGTLVDSNGIKWRAFESVFADAPERIGDIMAYCRQHHHTPRWEKFRHVYERILGRTYSPAIERDLTERFAAATTRQIIDAPELPGASEWLRCARNACAVTALLSSTPQETLIEIVSARGWRPWFTVIQGAPVQKTDWLRRWRRHLGVDGQDVVYFGDTEEDAQAAAAARCRFVGVGAAFRDGSIPAIMNFRVLLQERVWSARGGPPVLSDGVAWRVSQRDQYGR